MAITGPKASNQIFLGGRCQTTKCLLFFFFLIGGLLTSCICPCLLFSYFPHSRPFRSIAKQTSWPVSCLFSEPIYFWWIPSSSWLSVNHKNSVIGYFCIKHKNIISKSCYGEGPFLRCTSAWLRCCGACGPELVCSLASSPCRCAPASAQRWTPPPGASDGCLCCRSRHYVSGRSREACGSPAVGKKRLAFNQEANGDSHTTLLPLHHITYLKQIILIRNTDTHLHFPKAVVRHFVHQAVEQGGRSGLIHPKLALWCEIITLLHKKKHTQM